MASPGIAPDLKIALPRATQPRSEIEISKRCGLVVVSPPTIATPYLPGERIEPGINLVQVLRVKAGRQGQGNQSGGGCAGHRRYVAQATGQRLVPHFLRGGASLKMDTLDHGIGFEQKQAVRDSQIEHGAVIARTGDDRVIAGKRAGDPPDQLELLHLMRVNGSSEEYNMTKFMALKSACAVIGASKLSVFS